MIDPAGRWNGMYMKITNSRESLIDRTAARFPLVLAMVILAAVPALAPAAAPPGSGTARENPRFASLEVDIWPEYDRRAAVLVILKGELAPQVVLPATVSLRIPASSNPTAVAYATAPGSGLFNLEHERISGDANTTLRFRTSHRIVHVEFYDRLAPDDLYRRFTYVWPGDLAVDQLAVRLQEPAGASNILVKPELGAAVRGPDGLLYRSSEPVTVAAGKRLPIEVAYMKTDPRTTSEILGLKTPAAGPAPGTGSGIALPAWLLVVAVSAALMIGAAIVLLWWRVRSKLPSAPPQGAGFCPKCGSPRRPEDRFCPKCGAPLHGR